MFLKRKKNNGGTFPWLKTDTDSQANKSRSFIAIYIGKEDRVQYRQK